MRYNASDSSVTKQVKKDWNDLSDKEFFRKYSASKKTYLNRVQKYGDPYKNSPLAQKGKALSEKKTQKALSNAERILSDYNGNKAQLNNSGKLKKSLIKESMGWEYEGLVNYANRAKRYAEGNPALSRQTKKRLVTIDKNIADMGKDFAERSVGQQFLHAMVWGTSAKHKYKYVGSN
jgi:hypothetical protein